MEWPFLKQNRTRAGAWTLTVVCMLTGCKIRLANPGLTTAISEAASGASTLSTISATGPIVADGVATSTVTITVLELSGEPKAGVTPTFSATNSGATNIYGACTISDSSGVSHCTLASLKAETKALTLTSPTSNVMGGTVVFTAGPASQLKWSTLSNTELVATAFATQPVISIQDAQGNVVTSGPDATPVVTISLKAPSTGAISGTLTKVAVAGVADFAGQGLKIDHGGTKVLTASKASTTGGGGTGVLTADSASFEVKPIISIDSVSVHETGIAQFTVSLNGIHDSAVTFNWASANGAALAGTNYTAASGTAVSIAAGSTSTTLNVVTLDDSVAGTNKAFTVALSNITEAHAGTLIGTGTIVDSTLNLNFLSASLPPEVTFTRASTAKYYDVAGTLQTATSNTPRFDYDPVSHAAKGLLSEGSATNLLSQSAGFTTPGSPVGWNGWSPWNVTISTSAVLAPDGVSTAYLLTDTSATEAGYLESFATVPDDTTSYVFSVFVKATSTFYAAHIVPFFANGSGPVGGLGFFFDGSGAISFTYNFQSPTTTGYEDVGNGWYRVWVSITNNSTGSTTLRAAMQATNGTITNTNSLYVWGAQFEKGTYPSSYIPTAGTTATRAADIATLGTLTPWYDQTQGTWRADASIPGDEAGTYPTLFSAEGAVPSSDFYSVYAAPSYSRSVGYQLTTGSVDQGNHGLGQSYTAGTLFKTTFAFAADDLTGSIDGTLGTGESTATLPVITGIHLGGQASIYPLNGYLQRLIYWPARLGDQPLRDLTQ